MVGCGDRPAGVLEAEASLWSKVGPPSCISHIKCIKLSPVSVPASTCVDRNEAPLLLNHAVNYYLYVLIPVVDSHAKFSPFYKNSIVFVTPSAPKMCCLIPFC